MTPEERMQGKLNAYMDLPLARLGMALRNARQNFAAAREAYAARTRGREAYVVNALVAAGGLPLDPVYDAALVEKHRQLDEIEQIFARVHPREAKAREIHRRVHGCTRAEYLKRNESADHSEEARQKIEKVKKDRQRRNEGTSPGYTGESAKWQPIDV